MGDQPYHAYTGLEEFVWADLDPKKELQTRYLLGEDPDTRWGSLRW